MSTTRRRRKAPAHGPGTTAPQATPTAQPVPLPPWKWRTFPVFFMFSLGGFLGLYMGVIAGAAESGAFFTVFSIIWAVMLGAAFSRLSTHWIVSRRWARRQAKRSR